MEMDCNLKTCQADVFKFILYLVEKSPVPDYGLFFLRENHLISFS